MGSLKPGATYIYERVDGITYAREFGSPDRFPIGWDLEAQERVKKSAEEALWHDIRRSATDNEELQYAIERVKILYHLNKNDG